MIPVESVFNKKQLTKQQLKYQRESLSLVWEDRLLIHGRKKTDQGTAFVMALPTGTRLQAGQFFIIEEQKKLVEIVEQPEDVYVIKTNKAKEMAFLAHQIGNRHQPLMIGESELICQAIPAVKMLLKQLQVEYLQESRPFSPAVSLSHHKHL